MIDTKRNLRFERKYILNEEDAFLLKQRISYVISPDASGPNGQYHVSTLYFDDIYNTAFYEKLNSTLTRDKFRIRFYKHNLDTLRLECKHRHAEMISKDSALITHEQYKMMLSGDYAFMKKFSAAVFEKFYITHMLRQMRPVIMVKYDRQAYLHPSGNVRITFDRSLSASAPRGGHVFSILPEDNVILEIKYDRFIPSFVTGLFSGIPFGQQLSISKFSMAKLALQGI